MIQRGTLYRATLVAVVFLAALGGLGYRLYDLQVVRHEELLAKVRNLHERKQFLPAVRGSILDAKQNVLAQTVTVWSVAADPDLTRPHARQWAKILAPHLQMRERELIEKLSRPGRHVLLKKKVPDSTVAGMQEQIQALNERAKKNDRLKGLKLEREFQRYYPNGFLASHVIGFTANEYEEYGKQNVPAQRGLDGIEKVFDTELAGTVGYRRIEKDRQGRELVTYRREDVPPKNGLNVVLTVDQTLQHIVEEELDRICIAKEPKSAIAIVMRPDTGEILAMANRPTFDLNDPRKDVEMMKNLAIADAHEPGSTFKIVIVGAGLDQRAITLDETIFCENGKFLYAGRYLHDHRPYGFQTVRQIVAHSVNIGAAKIALKLGDQTVDRYVRGFGFGETTGIQLPGEARGMVHPPKSYSKISLTRIAMGHEVSVTALQLTSAMCAIANGGNLMQPAIVKRLVDEDGMTVKEFAPVVRRRVIERASAKQLTEALMGVVSRDGTAEKAALPGWTVAGKTGTAEKLDEDGRYEKGKYYSSFVGFFPVEKPQLCIFVGLDETRDYGGQVAAPVFREIALRSAAYLDLQGPNRQVRDGLPFANALSGKAKDKAGRLKSDS